MLDREWHEVLAIFTYLLAQIVVAWISFEHVPAPSLYLLGGGLLFMLFAFILVMMDLESVSSWLSFSRERNKAKNAKLLELVEMNKTLAAENSSLKKKLQRLESS